MHYFWLVDSHWNRRSWCYASSQKHHTVTYWQFNTIPYYRPFSSCRAGHLLLKIIQLRGWKRCQCRAPITIVTYHRSSAWDWTVVIGDRPHHTDVDEAAGRRSGNRHLTPHPTSFADGGKPSTPPHPLSQRTLASCGSYVSRLDISATIKPKREIASQDQALPCGSSNGVDLLFVIVGEVWCYTFWGPPIIVFTCACMNWISIPWREFP